MKEGVTNAQHNLAIQGMSNVKMRNDILKNMKDGMSNIYKNNPFKIDQEGAEAAQSIRLKPGQFQGLAVEFAKNDGNKDK